MHLPAQYFRAGAGAIITNRCGQVLVVERADIPGAWQLPQGGLKRGEEPLEAALREVAEETGIDEGDLDLTGAYPEPLVHELPPHARNKKVGRGQVQYWFLFRFHGNEDGIDISCSGELHSWKWMKFQNLLRSVVSFRKKLYGRLADHFSAYLS
jgi:putative (di)nucleoside polyphosphate hydrolase